MADRKKKKSRARTSISKHIRMLILLLLAYLLQVSVMPYFQLAGVTPSLIITTLSVVVVAFGKLRGFWAGAFFGIILEAMQPTRPMLNLMLYPVISILCGVMFSNKSSQQLEYERSIGKAGRDTSPLVRTPLACLVGILLYEVVNIVYIYLRGSDIGMSHIWRGMLDVILTVGLCVLLMLPMRGFIGAKYERELDNTPKPYRSVHKR